MKTLITAFSLVLIAGTANAQYRDNPRRGSNSYPFGYRSPYQGGFDGYGTYYGRGNGQLNNLPRYAPPGFPSRMHPSYQLYLNPYYGQYRPQPYLPYPYYYPE